VSNSFSNQKSALRWEKKNEEGVSSMVKITKQNLLCLKRVCGYLTFQTITTYKESRRAQKYKVARTESVPTERKRNLFPFRLLLLLLLRLCVKGRALNSLEV
jgi:hypothetical protein